MTGIYFHSSGGQKVKIKASAFGFFWGLWGEDLVQASLLSVEKTIFSLLVKITSARVLHCKDNLNGFKVSCFIKHILSLLSLFWWLERTSLIWTIETPLSGSSLGHIHHSLSTFFVVVVLGFELRALCLLSKQSLQLHFQPFSGSRTFARSSLGPPSSYLSLHSWDYRYIPSHPALFCFLIQDVPGSFSRISTSVLKPSISPRHSGFF
jgi:hypothetical protein